ncbi:MAG TPA: hypothetical protein PKX87_09805, partial [Alphaproteobacteria bacterium]|nr:hypothetical protein [Alphaproteobacteria bacterium]
MKILKSISDVTPELISKIIAPCVPFDTSQEHVVLSNGYDNFAVDFGAHIVRFPKDEEGLEGLRFEQKICNRILGLPLQTPRPIVIEGPTPFSWHRKIPGVWLTSDLYGALDDARKNDVCERLVDLFCFMHTIPHHEASAMGAQISSPHPEPEDLQRLLVSKVPPSLAGHFQETLEAYEQMIQTPSPMVFG